MRFWTRRDHYTHVPHYPGEPMEEAMRDYEKYPPMAVWGDSLEYVLATVLGRFFPWCRPSQRQLERIHRELLGYACQHCATMDELAREIKGIEELWPKLRKKLENNAGLVKFMNDVGSCSRSFAQFPATLVPRAIALESAFGVNYDNAGRYHTLEPGCISCRCGAVEATFVELRRRAWFAKSLIFQLFPELANYVDHPSEKKLGTVITLGAGLLVEFRKFGFTLAQIQSLNIIACDMDETLLKELDTVFLHDFGVPFAESGIDYRFCRIEELFEDPMLWGKADLVLLDGVLSYCRNKQHMLEYVAGAVKLMKPTGFIMCDWQLMEISLIRCAVVQCWESTMKPELTPRFAIRKAKWIARKLGLEIDYQVDPRNPRPLGVIVRYRRKPLNNLTES